MRAKNNSKTGVTDEQRRIVADKSSRLPVFRTHTVITEENHKKVVYKYASTEEAMAFLKLIVDKEKKTADYLRGKFDLLYGTLEGDRIKYEYLPYQSLQDHIAEHLRRGKHGLADKLLQTYVDKLNSIAGVKIFPDEFYKNIVGQVDHAGLQIDCLSPGLPDLTPRNILINGKKWIVIDNEWSFDFPIPRIFTLFRAIKETSVKIQHEIRQCTNKTYPAMGIFARGLQTYYFPKSWVKYITDRYISIAQMLRWEKGFQHYVKGVDSETVGRIKMRYRTKVHFSPWCLRNDICAIENISRSIKRLPGMRRLVHFSERALLNLQK